MLRCNGRQCGPLRSPAAQAGISRFDIISKIGDVRLRNVDDLTEVMRYHRPGETIKITVLKRADASKLHIVGVTLLSDPRQSFEDRGGEKLVDDFAADLGRYEGLDRDTTRDARQIVECILDEAGDSPLVGRRAPLVEEAADVRVTIITELHIGGCPWAFQSPASKMLVGQRTAINPNDPNPLLRIGDVAMALRQGWILRRLSTATMGPRCQGIEEGGARSPGRSNSGAWADLESEGGVRG